jgi:hypothetical protein
VAGILDGEDITPGLPQRARHEAESVREAVADHDALGIGAHPAHAGEIVDECLS